MAAANSAALFVLAALLLLALAVLVAVGVGRLAGRGRKRGIAYILTDMLIATAFCARIAFIAVWFDTYRAAPWAILDIRDGGFNPWAGVVGAMLAAIWHGRRRPELNRALSLGLMAGAFALNAMFAGMRATENTSLPKASLTTLAGEQADLAKLAAGKPMVVNLWATWCPPCRREMPVLAAAQRQEAGVRFVFSNQGEDAATVRRYLDAGGLDIANVVLDRRGAIGHEVGSAGLPTTLFYDARGRLVDKHVGALSAAALAGKLARLYPRTVNEGTNHRSPKN